MAKLVKPNQFRGTIFDKLATAFGDSTLGMYDGKLRFEMVDESTGEIVQFSLAPVVHKTLVEEAECDELVPIADQMAAYEAAQSAKSAANEKKKEKKTSTTKKTKKEDAPVATEVTPVADNTPVTLTEEEQTKLNELASLLKDGSF